MLDVGGLGDRRLGGGLQRRRGDRLVRVTGTPHADAEHVRVRQRLPPRQLGFVGRRYLRQARQQRRVRRRIADQDPARIDGDHPRRDALTAVRVDAAHFVRGSATVRTGRPTEVARDVLLDARGVELAHDDEGVAHALLGRGIEPVEHVLDVAPHVHTGGRQMLEDRALGRRAHRARGAGGNGGCAEVPALEKDRLPHVDRGQENQIGRRERRLRRERLRGRRDERSDDDDVEPDRDDEDRRQHADQRFFHAVIL